MPRKILIPWNDIKKEYEWINSGQGEPFIHSYVVKHPEIVEPGSIFVGIEVAIPKVDGTGYGRADVVLIKDQEYFLVEVKEKKFELEDALTQVIKYCRDLENHLEINGITYTGITPVVAVIDHPQREEYGPLVGGKIR